MSEIFKKLLETDIYTINNSLRPHYKKLSKDDKVIKFGGTDTFCEDRVPRRINFCFKKKDKNNEWWDNEALDTWNIHNINVISSEEPVKIPTWWNMKDPNTLYINDISEWTILLNQKDAWVDV